MSDIVVSVNEQKLKDLLEIYKKNFWGIHWEQEKYKWEAIAEFQDNWDINAEDFEKMFNSATYTANCKMDSGRGSLLDIQNSQPCVKILKLYNYIDSNGNKNADIVKQMFSNLFTNAELKDDLRIGTFINDVDNLWEKFSHKPNDKHDQHYAVTTYLWLKFPDKYFIYKYYVCRDLAIAVDSNYTPYKGPKRNKTFDSIIDSQKFYNKIRSYIMDDPEIDSILQECDRKIKFKKTDGEFAQKDYTKWLNTIVTDFAFYVRKYMEEKEVDNDDGDDMVINQPKNQILYGPPGTGKTYNTVFKSIEIINNKPYDNHDSATYETAKAEYDKLTKDGRIQFVTFHQSYSYEDFIEGIKPKLAKNECSEQTESGQIEYEIKDGIFKRFCISADPNCIIRKKDKYKPQEQNEAPTDRYVFIIDEINRGNISKIFGELITLIEETKRKGTKEEMSAALPYSGDKFTVPDNVYIIGTMNTADRSLAVVDTALRRRFTFEEMMPDPDLLDINVKGNNKETINIKNLLTVMNNRIAALYDREHTIGHGYFMGLSNNSQIEDLGVIFKNKIIPLLQEYFYEDYEKIRLVLGDNQKKDKEIEFIVEDEITSKSLFGDDNILDSNIKNYKVNDEAFNKAEAYRYLGLVDAQTVKINNTQESQGSNT